MPEEFWATNPLVLIHPKYLHRFFPSDRLHTAARMNAVMRCGLYISIIISAIRREPIWMLIPLITAGVTASWMYHEDPHIFSKSSKYQYKRNDDDEEDGNNTIVEDIFNHYNGYKEGSYNPKDQDIEALANEIITKQIHKYPKKDLRRKHEREKQKISPSDPRFIGNYSPDPRLFQDMDTSIQQMQRERAIVTSSVAGGIPDTPKFSRKMMKMDEKKTKPRR